MVPELSVHNRPETGIILPDGLQDFRGHIDHILHLVERHTVLPGYLPGDITPVLSFPFVGAFPHPVTLAVTSDTAAGTQTCLGKFLLYIQLVFCNIQSFLSGFGCFCTVTFIYICLFFVKQLVPDIQ